MKGKPDIGFAKPKRDPTAFLEGGVADRSESAPAPQVPMAPETGKGAPASPVELPSPSEGGQRPAPTVQKLFRLKVDTANALRLSAAQLSTEQARRVTETEIVENLIRAHFKLES